MELAGHYEWMPDERARLLTHDEQGRRCSHPYCKSEAVLVMMRTAYHWRERGGSSRVQRRQFCCDLPEHNYGRKVENGQVYVHQWVWDDDAAV
jgi:hypothetical protein